VNKSLLLSQRAGASNRAAALAGSRLKTKEGKYFFMQCIIKLENWSGQDVRQAKK